ncbi:MAG: hypothetical protein IJ795_03420 [Bacteroidales bacterium]|nr:hypothetical protein [Bacteroidales bacterium]
MLEGELFQRTGPDTFRLLPSSVIYKAHFPGYPITPGVCIVRIVTEMLHPGQTLSSARNIRFVSPLMPGDEARIEESGGRVLICKKGEICAKMVMEYE